MTNDKDTNTHNDTSDQTSRDNDQHGTDSGDKNLNDSNNGNGGAQHEDFIDTTGRVKLNPIPLSFGGVKKSGGNNGNGAGDSRLPRKFRPGSSQLALTEETERRHPNLDSPRKIIRQGMIIVGLFFGILGVWSFFGHIKGAIVAPGHIKIDNERKIVQHLEGGIIDEILVREGEEVLKDQPLLVLESVSVDANTNMLQKELLAMEAQRQRFLVEKDYDGKTWPTALQWSEDVLKLAREADSEDVLENESKIFRSRQENLKNQISLVSTQIRQYQAQIGGLEEQVSAEGKIIAALHEELNAKRKLHKDRFVDKTQILSLEKDLASHQGTRGRVRQQISEIRQKITEGALRINDAIGKFIEDAVRNLGDLDNNIIQNREKLRPLQDQRKRLEIVSPCAGRVVDLKVHTPGSVIQPGQTLMDIVPHDNPLIVETQVPVHKITEVYIGQKARVSLDAFDTRMLPQIPGEVTYISADALQDKANPSSMYYLCYVTVSPQALKDESMYLTPGMPATVYLTTSEKTVIYYMLEPYIKSWDRALRD